MSVDWERYQKCTTCGAALSKPCIQLGGFVPGAQGGVVEIEADEPHTGRELRAAAARDAQFGRAIDR